MYFQRQEVIGAPPILASIGSIFSVGSKRDKLSPTYQLFVGIGYIFYLIVFMLVITKVIQPNEIYSSIYSVQNILKSANWNSDLSTPKNSMVHNIQTNNDIQNWMFYVLGPPLLNGHIADQNQLIGASLTKCIGEYIHNNEENNYIPSDYGVIKVLNLGNCNETRLNLVSRIASPYKYLEEFFSSPAGFVIQEIEPVPELPKLPKISNRTDIISYTAELLFYNGNIDTYSVISFTFNLSMFGTFIVDVLSQSASPIKKFIGFPCEGNCNLNMSRILKTLLLSMYFAIFIFHLFSGILLLISSASGSQNSTSISERNTLGIESWSNYYKERSLSIAIRLSHFSVISLWISSGVLVQLLPNQTLDNILEKSNEVAKKINLNQSSEIPILNSIISIIKIASILRFSGTVMACIASFLMLFRIFQIFSSLFSQINVPLKTVVLYFKKVIGLFFLLNLTILTLALGIIIYLHIDRYSAIIKGYKSSFTTSLFLLLLSPFSNNRWEESTVSGVTTVPTAIFVSTVLGIATLYLMLIPLSTATIMFIYNEVEILQSLKQNTDNIYTIKTTLNAWIQQLFFLSTFWQSKKFFQFSSQSRETANKIIPDSQNEIEAQSHKKNDNITKEIILNEDNNKVYDSEKHLKQWFVNKKKQLKNFFDIPPKLEFVPYHLLFLILLFSIISIYWIVHVISYQLYTGTADIIWKILDTPFSARSYYSFNPTLEFYPYMFKNCSDKTISPKFLFDKSQLSNIPDDLIYGLYQSYRLTNITSMGHLKTWIEKIFIPLVNPTNSNKPSREFLTDLGYPIFYSTINPILLFKQHFSPVKCNSNPVTSGLYKSIITKSKSSLDIKDISNFNKTSINGVFSTSTYESREIYDSKERNLNSNKLKKYVDRTKIINRLLGVSKGENAEIESIFSGSGVDRVFFLYAGTESEISQQFQNSLIGNDKGNLFWIIRSYSLSKGNEISVEFVPSIEQYRSDENIGIPYNGLFDYNMDNLEIYLPIVIPTQQSISLLSLNFEILRTGKIDIIFKFDYVKDEWINKLSDLNIDMNNENDTETNNTNSNMWIFSHILIGIQIFIFLIFTIIIIFNFYRKKLLSRRIMHQINYKMDISDSESDDSKPEKGKIRRLGIKKVARKIKRKEIDTIQKKKHKLELKTNFNAKNEFKGKKNLRKNEYYNENFTDSNYIVEELDDEDILSLYKLSNLNLFAITLMSIAFFILFFSAISYYILIISTKVSINVNSIDIEAGFNSIASSQGSALPWEIGKSRLDYSNSKLNMIGSSSGLYNENVFSLKNLFMAIISIKEISDYFGRFELFGVLLIITYLSIIFTYSSLLIDRHRKVKMLRMKRYFEKTGRKSSGNSFESLSVFTFMDTTSQRGFSWNHANYAFIPIFCVVFSFILIFSLTGYSLLGYQEATYFSYYYSLLSSLLIIYNYNSVKHVIMTTITPDMSIRFTSNIVTFFWRPIYYLITFFTFNFILKALIPASIIFYMRSVASKNLQASQDTLLSKLNNIAVTRPSIPIFMNESISLRMKFFIKALYKKLGKFRNFDHTLSLLKDNATDSEKNERDIYFRDNPDWIFSKLIPELFNEIIHYRLNIAELVNKDQQGIQEIRDYLGNISLQLLLIQEHLVKIEFLRCKLSMIRQELMKIEDIKKDISRGNRESQHYIDRLLQRLISINDEIEHLDESNRVLGQERESVKQKNTSSASANYSLQKEKDKFSTDFLFEYDHSHAKALFENSKINDIACEELSESNSESDHTPNDIKDNLGKNRKRTILNCNFNGNKQDESKIKETWKRD
ncbi:putative integral membrane protein [Cryptosporidium felis]|nr:putative integral membrane protein [Cryptosporidium felis]